MHKSVSEENRFIYALYIDLLGNFYQHLCFYDKASALYQYNLFYLKPYLKLFTNTVNSFLNIVDLMTMSNSYDIIELKEKFSNFDEAFKIEDKKTLEMERIISYKTLMIEIKILNCFYNKCKKIDIKNDKHEIEKELSELAKNEKIYAGKNVQSVYLETMFNLVFNEIDEIENSMDQNGIESLKDHHQFFYNFVYALIKRKHYFQPKKINVPKDLQFLFENYNEKESLKKEFLDFIIDNESNQSDEALSKIINKFKKMNIRPFLQEWYYKYRFGTNLKMSKSAKKDVKIYNNMHFKNNKFKIFNWENNKLVYLDFIIVDHHYYNIKEKRETDEENEESQKLIEAFEKSFKPENTNTFMLTYPLIAYKNNDETIEKNIFKDRINFLEAETILGNTSLTISELDFFIARSKTLRHFKEKISFKVCMERNKLRQKEIIDRLKKFDEKIPYGNEIDNVYLLKEFIDDKNLNIALNDEFELLFYKPNLEELLEIIGD